MKDPLISIVIPVYNGSNYLAEAINSALNQTYKNIEVIVVNDGSTDNGKTEAIAKSYGNKVRYFKKKNGHVASALNYGIKRMKGDWFAWLSHDDMFIPGKSALEIKYIKKYPQTKVFYGNTAVVNSKGKLVSANNPKSPHKIRGGIWFWRSWIYGCSLLINKSCFEVAGYFREDNRTTQDVENALSLLSHYELVHIPEIVTKRRNHSASDFHTLRELNIAEGNTMLLNLLNAKGIEYFFPDLKKSKSTPTDSAIAYNKLASYMLRGNPKIADYCYTQSRSAWRSPKNIAFYTMLVGSRIIGNIINSLYFIRNVSRGGIKKVKNVLNLWLQ